MRPLACLMSCLLLFLAATEADAAGNCLSRLTALGAGYRPIDRLSGAGPCGAATPVELTSLPTIGLSTSGTFTCQFAERLVRWAEEVVVPAARRHLGTAPARIRLGTTYQCRRQNHRPDAKLSEHAFANALDLTGFDFADGSAVAIASGRDAQSPVARFQRAVRSGSCKFFTTVLGPGADDLHGGHLHLDLRSRKGGYRICQ